MTYGSRKREACDEHAVPWIIENPRSSFLWQMPSVLKLAARPTTRVHHLHQCRYGCPWMKPTTMMSGGGIQDAPALELVCKPVRRGGLSLCSVTGKPHFVLSNPSVTKQAQTYSPELADALCRTFRDAWRV